MEESLKRRTNGPNTAELLGYSTFKTSVNKYDGVVINYRMIGPTHNKIPIDRDCIYNGGRTLTHEVGHWLDLLNTNVANQRKYLILWPK